MISNDRPNMSQILEDWYRIFTKYWKIASISSTSFGGAILFFYLYSAGAPLPVTDPGIISVLFIIFLLSLASFLLFAWIIGFPAFISSIRPPIIVSVLTGFSTAPAKKRRFLLSYLIMYMPFYGVSVVLIAWVQQNANPSLAEFLGASALVLIILTPVSLAMFWHEAKHKGYESKRAAQTFIFTCLASNVASILWIIYTSVVISDLIESDLNGIAKNFGTYSTFIITLLIHLSLANTRGNLNNFIFILLSVAFIATAITPGASSISASMLRVISAGGNIPVSFEVRTIDSQGKISKKDVSSCLILSTSSTIITRHPTKIQGDAIDCREDRHLFDEIKPPPPLRGIEIYNRQDILVLKGAKQIEKK